jgi:hypothetical protein
MKLYTEEQVKEAMRLAILTYDSTGDIFQQLTPIELPSHRDIMERANQQVDKTKDNYFVGFAACSEYYEQTLRQLTIIKTNIH